MENKKGLMFEALMFIVILIVLITAFAVLSKKQDKFTAGYQLGDRQFDVINSYQKGEGVLLYIDQSAKHSIQQAAYYLGKKGGFKEASGCGRYAGFNIWADIKKDKDIAAVEECYPESKEVSEGMVYIFNDEINEYFALFPSAFIPGKYAYNLYDNIRITAKSKNEGKIAIPIKHGSLVATGFAAAPAEHIIGAVPSSGEADIKTIRANHPEVLQKYEELCRKMGYEPYPAEQKQCYITSGYRDPESNRKAEGSKNSLHMKALAIDFHVGGVEEQLEWAKAASDIGFTGIVIYPYDQHLHVDLRPEKIFLIALRGSTLASYQSFEGLEKGAERYT